MVSILVRQQNQLLLFFLSFHTRVSFLFIFVRFLEIPVRCLPAAAGKLLLGLHGVAVDTNHGLTETGAALGEDGGVLVVSRGADDGLGALRGVAGLEDTGANEDTIAAELHHEGSISGSGNTTGGEVDNGEAAELSNLAEELSVDLELAGHLADADDATFGEGSLGLSNLLVDGLHVADSLDNVTGASLALGADHGSTLSNAAEGLAEVAAAADEGGLEGALLDVALVVSGSQDLRLVNVVDAKGLEDLALDKVADTGLGHDGDGDGGLDLLDDGGVRHARNTAVLADVSGNALEGHDGASTGLLSNASLLGVGHVHDDTALEHLGEASLDGEGSGGVGAVGGGLGSHFVCVLVCVCCEESKMKKYQRRRVNWKASKS